MTLDELLDSVGLNRTIRSKQCLGRLDIWYHDYERAFLSVNAGHEYFGKINLYDRGELISTEELQSQLLAMELLAGGNYDTD